MSCDISKERKSRYIVTKDRNGISTWYKLDNGIMDCCGYLMMRIKKKEEKKEEKTVPAELEGGGHSWWWVCGDCHGTIRYGEKICRHCGVKVEWDE